MKSLLELVLETCLDTNNYCGKPSLKEMAKVLSKKTKYNKTYSSHSTWCYLVVTFNELFSIYRKIV